MTKDKGTYAALRVLQPSNRRLLVFCEANGIIVNKSTFEDRLHTTLIYSRDHCPNMVAAAPGVTHRVRFKEYQIFTNRASGDSALVMILDAPTVLARHHWLMDEHSATYDFDEFTPHITLTYEFMGNVRGLKPYPYDIMLGQEYVEDLDLEVE